MERTGNGLKHVRVTQKCENVKRETIEGEAAREGPYFLGGGSSPKNRLNTNLYPCLYLEEK